MVSKTFVKVTAEHDESGQVRPLSLTWTDGKKYEIDRLTDVRQAPSLRAAGWGCYTRCGCGGKRFICLRMRAEGLSRGEISRGKGN